MLDKIDLEYISLTGNKLIPDRIDTTNLTQKDQAYLVQIIGNNEPSNEQTISEIQEGVVLEEMTERRSNGHKLMLYCKVRNTPRPICVGSLGRYIRLDISFGSTIYYREYKDQLIVCNKDGDILI